MATLQCDFRLTLAPGRVLAALVITSLCLPAQQAKLRVTVFDPKTGEPAKDLRAENFSVVDDKTQLRVERAEYKESLLDVMVLVDTSLVGEAVRPLGEAFIQGLGEKEQMAVVAYHESAELIQDFTSSKQLLQRSLAQVQYGNNPRVLDALYAVMDSGFENTAGRRVIIVLSAGLEGNSRVPEAEIFQLARLKGVSIYPVFVVGAERWLFRRLAERTGGAFFGARNLELSPKALCELVYSVVRGQYELDVSGVHTLGNKVEVKVTALPKSRQKVWASALPLD